MLTRIKDPIYGYLFLIALIVVALGVGLATTPRAQQAPAQSTAAKPAAAPAPALDELGKALVQNVVLAAQLANSECGALASMKQFQQVRADTTARLEAKYPGYTPDYNAGVLVAKPTPDK